MALPFFNWSRTAASNSTADSTINWAEGQAPSTVNDSARAMMASTAAYRDDTAGAITTGGSATAYTVTSYQVFDSLAHLNGQVIAFVPHATNTNAVGVDVTLNVDGLGAKSIRAQPSVALPNGSLVLGTPYVVTYNSSDAVFYLRGMTNPYNIPLGGSIDFFGTTAPNSSFALGFGQALSRETYATLFTLFSTTFGVGDGSSTFNIPDLRGRVVAGKDDMGGSAASRITTALSGVDGLTLGSAAGNQNQNISQAQLPNATLAVTGSLSVTSSVSNVVTGTIVTAFQGAGVQINALSNGTGGSGTLTSTGSLASGVTASINGGVSQTGLINVQPTIIANKLIRII